MSVRSSHHLFRHHVRFAVALAFALSISHRAALADGSAASNFGLSLGVGSMSFQSTRDAEASKRGFYLPLQGTWKKPLRGDLSTVLSGGVGMVNIQGANAAGQQSVLQGSIVADQSLYCQMGASGFAIGAGLSELLGPGSGLEYQNPSAGLLTFALGPRLLYQFASTAAYAGVSAESSLNLGAGRFTTMMLTLGYHFNSAPPPQAAVPTPAPQAVDLQATAPLATTATAATTLATTPTTAQTTRPREVFHANRATTRLEVNGHAPLSRGMSFLAELADVLSFQHRDEWSTIELKCGQKEPCLRIKQKLITLGLSASRIKVQLTSDSSSTSPAEKSSPLDPELSVVVQNLGMIGLLEAKEKSWLANQVRIFESEQPENEKPRLRSVFKALAKNQSSWKTLTCFLPHSPMAKRRKAEIEALAKRYGLKAFEFAWAPSESDRNDGARALLTIDAEVVRGADLLQRQIRKD